jgi:hypothetical protein
MYYGIYLISRADDVRQLGFTFSMEGNSLPGRTTKDSGDGSQRVDRSRGSGPLYWKSKKQTIVTLSSTKAESINLTPAGLTAIWITNILKEAGCPQKKPFILFTDSANAQQIALKLENAARTRHIDVRYKWIQDRIKKGQFNIKHVPTTEMVADGLTKPLGREKFAQFWTISL